MIVRKLELDDIPRIAKWNTELHEDEGSIPLTIEAATDRLQRWFESNRFQGAIFVAEEQPVGCLLYELRRADDDQRATKSIYVRQFFICRKSRGKGLGKSAFDLFVRTLVPTRARIELEIKASNPAGRAFWESLGFSQISAFYERDTPPVADD